MKIRYLSGPKVGVQSHVQNQIGRALVDAGLAEVVEAEKETGPYLDEQGMLSVPPGGAAAPVAEKWAVILLGGLRSQKVLAIQLTLGGTVYRYVGDPKFTNARREWPGGGRYIQFGREVPERIAREYKKQWQHNEHLRGPYQIEPYVQVTENTPSGISLTDLKAMQKNADRIDSKAVEAQLAAFNQRQGA